MTPLGDEKSTVQYTLISYAQETGWEFIGKGPLALRGGRSKHNFPRDIRQTN